MEIAYLCTIIIVEQLNLRIMKDMESTKGEIVMCKPDYTTLLRHIKLRVAQAQQRAIYSANEELLRMYWDVGEMLTGSQMADGWGQKTLERLSVDMKNEFPKIKGFSVRNMQFMMQFYNEYNSELTMVKTKGTPITKLPISQLHENAKSDKYPIVQSPIAQLPTYVDAKRSLYLRHVDFYRRIQ